MSEVTFINTDYDCILFDELSDQPADPDPLLIVSTVSVLGICLIKSLVLETELVLHDLSDDPC